ncbi:hypothetical protein [Nostoc sp.]|uniref:hypothetical protein n=1 Tax=Nostoc sp. TaxID=1180 RepID=UPI002FF8477D
MTLCTFGVSVFSIPALASPDDVCMKTSSGQVVCGKPVQSPNSSSQKPDSDETIQTETVGSLIVELKFCARKMKTVSCTFSLSSTVDVEGVGFSTKNSRMVDPEGTEYRPSKLQIGKNIAGSNGFTRVNMVKDIKYKGIVDIAEVPTSTPYISLLEIVLDYTINGAHFNFRNVPIINPDGSSAPVPDTPKPRVSQPSSNNNPVSIPKVCLPIVGCLHQ